jgi:hypothetical protein
LSPSDQEVQASKDTGADRDTSHDQIAKCPACGERVTETETDGVVFRRCTCGWTDDPALQLLEDPGLLYRLEQAITAPDSAEPLFGENDNALTLLFILIGKGSVEVRGQTASGKNALVDHVLAIFPRDSWEKVGGVTDKSLRYLQEDIRILYVTERRGLESGQRGVETTAEYDAKLSISEHMISVAVTERDPDTHEFRTVFRNVAIDSIIFTTTEVSAPPELENRLNVLYVKDDFKQNALVRDAQLRAATVPSWERRDVAAERAIASQALRHVMDQAPGEVIIPFAPALAQILSDRSSVVRRNTPKLLTLIKSCARLHYRQRQTIQGTNGKRAIVAEPLDLAIVLYTSMRALSAALSTTPEKAAFVLEVCKELVSAELPITVDSILLNGKDRPLGAKQTVRSAVRYLAEKGVLTESQEKQGKVKVYELQSTEAPLVLDVPKILRDASEEYERWVGTYLGQASSVNESKPNHSLVDVSSVIFTLDAPRETNPSSDSHVHSGNSATGVNFTLDAPTSANPDSDGFTLDARPGDIHLSQSGAAKDGLLEGPGERGPTHPELIAEVIEAKGERLVHCKVHGSWHRLPEVWERHLAIDHVGQEAST